MSAESQLTELLYHTALKGAVVLVVALLAGLALRKTAAARRYALWITAVITLALLPVAVALLPTWQALPKILPTMEQEENQRRVEIETSGMELQRAASRIDPFLQIPPAKRGAIKVSEVPRANPIFTWSQLVGSLPLVWLAVAASLLLRLAWSVWLLHRLEKSLSVGTCDGVIEIASEMGLKRVPRLLTGPQDAVPMVWGVWRPRLLLPAGFEDWDKEKQRAVLLHELAHVKRGDPLALWAAQWVKALHWFNPLAWLTLRQMRADQEHACDDTALRHGVRPSDYAQHLLDLSRHTRIAPGLALCALTITRSAPVESRVEAILDPKRHREALTPRWLIGVALFALSTALPVAMLHAIEGPKLRGRILDRNGVVLAESTQEKVRNYPLKALAAHVIGYTRTGENDGPRYGVAGAEKQHNSVLGAGEDQSLTLDVRIQALTHRAMTEAGYTRGVAVVLNPLTGEILASVSLPTYDPNVFIPAIRHADWDRINDDRDNPLFNRTLAAFVPGSALMPLTALAGIAAGVGEQKFTCEGSVIYGSRAMPCWINRQGGGSHGELGMAGALVASCSCFWYQFGNAAGIEQIESVERKIGIGTRYGVGENESEGIMPSPAWLKEHQPGQKWSEGYTANTAIGQGAMLATPLQLAVLAATVANAGKVPQPRLFGNSAKTEWRADLIADGSSAAQIEQLREGMRLVVNGESGAGKLAHSDKVVIAGKTATAQHWRRGEDNKKEVDNHAWFIGFAPFENPTLAFAILKQGGKSGGGDCAPIAKRIVEEILALPADGSGEVLPVEDEVGAAHAKSQAAKAEFDARGDALKQEIEQAAPDAKTGFALDEVSVKDGRVVVRGSASGMIQALQFRDKLAQIGEVHQIEWMFPVPKTLGDGKRVGFEALGVPSGSKKTTVVEGIEILGDAVAVEWQELRQAAGLAKLPGDRPAMRGEPGEHSVRFGLSIDDAVNWLRSSLGDQTDVVWLKDGAHKGQSYSTKTGFVIDMARPDPRYVMVTVRKRTEGKRAERASDRVDDGDILLKPEVAKQWSLLQERGRLAHLPADARLLVKTATSSGGFSFQASRASVLRWLRASMGESKAVTALETRESFKQLFKWINDCHIEVASSDGNDVQVTVWRGERRILIAPETLGKPIRSLGGLGLDSSLSVLGSSLSPLDPRIVGAYPDYGSNSIPFVQNDLNMHVVDDSTPAFDSGLVNEVDLLNKLNGGKRFDQSLVVRPPEPPN